MLVPRTDIMSVAVALAMLGRAGAVLRGGQNVTHSPLGKSTDPCECKNWHDVYYTRGGSMGLPSPCGMSNEFFFASGIHQPSPEHVGVLQGAWGSICRNFFMKINDNVCVNINIGTEYGQWCFVDGACKVDPHGPVDTVHPRGPVDSREGEEPRGGFITGNKMLKWKHCTSGRDRMLRDFSVPDLAKFVAEQNIPFYLADHYAWPAYHHGTWNDVREYFVPGSGNGKPISWEVREELDGVVDYNKPVVFFQEKTAFNPTHMIVEGSTMYSVVARETRSREHMSSWSTVVEVRGTRVQRRLL